MDGVPATRLHALDNLRALMMWLGIVLHVAVVHMTRDAPLPWQDGERTRFADVLVAFIHAFRMPVFFVLAGFFVAMLMHSRGPVGMARHRALRLGVPFAVLWPPIFAASIVCGLAFVHRIERGTWGLDVELMTQRMARLGLPAPAGPNTLHLWFLWLLLWMSLATALLAHTVPPAAWERPARLLRALAGGWWGPIVLALPVAAADLTYPRGLLYPSGAWLPPAAEWIHNGVFYLVGLAIYAVRDDLFVVFVRRRWTYAVAGLVTFFVAGGCVEQGATVPFTIAYSITSWLWSFALIGLALQHLGERHRVLAYLAESSYWVYLVHFPLTVAFGAVLFTLDLPALAKMGLNIAATTLVCLASYHVLVRFTWLGVMLNGKRHERRAVTRAAYAAR